jgi:hypothetical protein
MTDDYEVPDFSEMSFDEIESILDKQDARLKERKKPTPGGSLIGLIPYLPFAALFVIAFLIT